jgi:hypothetical protein
MRDVRLFVGNVVNEAGVLVRKAVMILPPDIRQTIRRSLVRAHQTEIAVLGIQSHHVAHRVGGRRQHLIEKMGNVLEFEATQSMS